MSETHFDRADWRPGKRRRTQPRVKCYGGQKIAPVGLVAARAFVGLNTLAAKKCVRIACRPASHVGTRRCAARTIA
jgi:hypothetical protein